MSSIYLEKEKTDFEEYVGLPKLHLLVAQITKHFSPENCARSVEELIKLLPNYELELDSTTKVSLAFQAHIFHYKSGNLLKSIPVDFDPTLRQIYLVSDIASGDSNIFHYIPSLKNYIQTFGKFCFFCKKHFTSRGCNHKCSKVLSCFSCKRPFLQPNTFLTCENKIFFCNSSLIPALSQRCSTCNITYFSQECYDEHRKKVCRWGWKCLKCNIYQGRNGFFKTQSEIKAKHLCHQRYCNFCGEVKSTPHFCTLKQHKPCNEFTNLGFVSFSYSGFNVSKCKACYLKNDGSPCPKCPSNTETPVACIILQESKTRDSFNSHIIVETKNDEIPAYCKGEQFQYAYIPSFVFKKPTLAPEGRKTRFGKRRKGNKNHNIFCKPNMTLLDRFFDFLLKNNFSNSTIFVYSGISKDMFFILQGLLNNGFSPNIVKNHNQIMLIEEQKLCLRFVEVQNYLHCSFRELCERIKKPIPFFPLQWIQERYFSYIGQPPVLEDFFDFEDTEEEVEKKKLHLAKMPCEWNFLEEYFSFLTLKVEIIAAALLEFFKESFYCQNVILKHFKDLSPTWFFMHPANPPIFTAATYSFQLFLQMSKQANVLKTINRPIPFNSSKGEIEYIMYIIWKNPDLNIETAWSPYGQTNLRYTKPDAITENEIWYYNGCYFHGHSKKHCKFNSKVTIEMRQKREKEFMDKLEKLKNEMPDTKVTVMWECVWREMKKKDKEVIFFLKNIFRNPPMTRLDPREAGEYFKAEANNIYESVKESRTANKKIKISFNRT